VSSAEQELTGTSGRIPTFDLSGLLRRVGAAMLFLGLGLTKFESESYWVGLFAQIGFGDWFRYLTGAVQVVGGMLFLAPRTVALAALVAGGTMVGAVLVRLFVLDTGFGGAIIPLAVLVGIIIVATRRHD
jgi:hypothetical protein